MNIMNVLTYPLKPAKKILCCFFQTLKEKKRLLLSDIQRYRVNGLLDFYLPFTAVKSVLVIIFKYSLRLRLSI